MSSRYPDPNLAATGGQAAGGYYPGSYDPTGQSQGVAGNGVGPGLQQPNQQQYQQQNPYQQQMPPGQPGQMAMQAPNMTAAGYATAYNGVSGQVPSHGVSQVQAGFSQGGGQSDVQGLGAQMGSMTLGGRPMPPDFAQAQAQAQGYYPNQQSTGQTAEPQQLPRPRFDSEGVLNRINDLDKKEPIGTAGSLAPAGQQLDAYGRPMPGALAQSAARWPPTVACPPELYYPASPRCARMTTSAFPNSQSLAKKYGLPLGVILQPLEDGDQLPVVNFGKAGVIRCRRCRSYVNFMCKFMEDGRRWRCSLCQFSNDVPQEYWCGLNQQGYREDVAQRAELLCGSYEVVAPGQYMLRPPMPPVYMFLLEVTASAVSSGLLNAAATGIRESLSLLPHDDRTCVGIMTFDSTVHFYRFKGDGTSDPSVIVMPDINDVFLPAPDNIIVSLQEERTALDQLLERLPTMFASAAQPGMGVNAPKSTANSAFGAALLCAQKVLEHVGGRVISVLSSRPKLGPGALKDRSDNTTLGTDRERVLLSPDSLFYKQKAVELSKLQVSVDLLICTPTVGSFIDVATLAPLAKYTGGDLQYCPGFDVHRDGYLLVESLKRSLGRETAWEGVMRIRASKGVRCSTFHGRFFLRATDLLALPSVDPDKKFAVEFAYDENVLEHQVFSVQAALLHTTSGGERRIRVHTITVPVVSTIGDLFLYTDAQATTTLIARRAAESLRDKRLADVRKAITEPLVHALAAYRQATNTQYGASRMAAGGTDLFLPESLSLFPLLLQGLLKSPLFSRDSFSLFGFRMDDKAALIHAMNIVSTATVSCMTYPTILPLCPLDDYPDAGVYTEDGNGIVAVTLPPALPAMLSTLQPDRVLLIDDGLTTIIWIGSAVMQTFCEIMVGATQTDIYGIAGACIYGGPEGDGGRVRAIIRNVRGLMRAGAPIYVVPQGSAMQARAEALMVEERTSSQVSYGEFIIDIQKQVQMRTA